MSKRRRSRRSTLPLGGSAGWAPGRLVGHVAGGHFRFDGLLGVGGLGEVYEARDLDTDTAVAIKVMLPIFREFPAAVLRFEREARASLLLDHPNIVDVTATGTLDDGSLFLVMELVPGDDLALLLEEDGAFAPRRAITVALQLLRGLEHAHSRGVLHRDLKPANVMISGAAEQEVAKILDFGLAKLFGYAAQEGSLEKLTETGAVFGTPAYMAPEQVLGRPATAETDLYSVGVILFEMISGRQPFRGSDPHATMRQHVHGEIPSLVDASGNPACPAALDAVIHRVLQKTRKTRFSTATEMIGALEDIVRTMPVDA